MCSRVGSSCVLIQLFSVLPSWYVLLVIYQLYIYVCICVHCGHNETGIANIFSKIKIVASMDHLVVIKAVIVCTM